MIAPLLLAAALQHLPVNRVSQPPVLGREAAQKIEDTSLSMLAYCDARGQSTIMVTNLGPTPLVVEWTLTATIQEDDPDTWSSVSRVEPGQFEGWMSPAPYLHLEIRYDEDGLPKTDSVDAFCLGPAGQYTGLEE